MWDKNLRKNGHMYVYNWITVLYTWKKHNIVTLLQYKVKIKLKKRELQFFYFDKNF